MRLQTGIALHQWPRNKIIREIISAPKGFLLVEHDFSGQESRWMCEASNDAVMLKIFTSEPPYDDLHSYMGAILADRDFTQLVDTLKTTNNIVGIEKAIQDRYLGKFANLSLQYRTSAKTLCKKARIDYGIPMLLPGATIVKSQFESTLTGIPAYWQSQIQFAQQNGYVETFSGKRYRFRPDAWTRKNTWSSGSTAINFPIQGVGASQKSLAMKYLIPYLRNIHGRFAFDLHDGLFSYLPERTAYQEALKIQDLLSNLPYFKEWGYQPKISFPVDASIGKNWGTLQAA